MKQKETPKSPMSGGKGAEVSKTLFYKQFLLSDMGYKNNFIKL